MNRRQIIFIICSILGIALLLWSASDFYALMRGDRLGASFCTVNAYWNCDQASLSALGSFKMIPIGVFGAFWFAVTLLFGIGPQSYRKYLKVLFGLGIFASLILASYLTFVLKVGCIVCFTSYALIAGVIIAGSKLQNGLQISKKSFIAALCGVIIVFSIFTLINREHSGGKFSEDEFRRWFERVESISQRSSLTKGPTDAPIMILEFSDFGCPFCGLAAETLLPFLAKQPDVQIHYFPFPLDNSCNAGVNRQVHAYSCEWARGAICANEQGKLWPFHDRAFKINSELGHLPPVTEDLDSFDLDSEKFKQCLDKPETAQTLTGLIQAGLDLRISSTPTFFINGRRFEGYIPIPLIRRTLDEFRKAPGP